MPPVGRGRAAALVLLLAGCAAPGAPSPGEALATAREDCASRHAAGTPGNSVARIRCLNAVDDRLVRPRHPFPDLLDLQNGYRLEYAERVDAGRMMREDARRAQARVDAKVADIYEQRRAARRTSNSVSFAAQSREAQALRTELDALRSGQSGPAHSAGLPGATGY